MFEGLFKKQKNSWEILQDQISKRIDFLDKNCLEESEFDIIAKELNLLDKYENLTEKEEQQMVSLESKLEATSLEVKTLPEFKFALERLGLDSQLIDNVVAHENAHLNKAEILDAKPIGFMVAFYKKSNGDGAISPMAVRERIGEKDGISKEHWRVTNIEIALAPNEYGNAASKSDLEKVERLKNDI